MATWQEQLSGIEKMREKRRSADDNLYAVQLALLKATADLRKIAGQHTIVPVNKDEIEQLRKKIAELDSHLQEIDKELNEINAFFNKIKQLSEKIEFISRKIGMLRTEVNELNTQLASERNTRRPDPAKVKDLEQQLEKTKQFIKELEEDLAELKRELEQLNQRIRELEANKRELERKRESKERDRKALQDELNEKLNFATPSEDEAKRKKAELEEQKKRAKLELDRSINDLHLAITAIYVDPHPRSVVNNLDDSIPFLLLPVRIETRFMTTNDSPELWLRIYPDDIFIHTHEKTLTTTEISEGENYWKLIFIAEKKPGDEAGELKKEAWSKIVALFSSQRSAWIALQTQPTNWKDLANLNNADQLIFPQHDLSKPFEWSRAPRTNVLPDKFVIQLYQGNSVAKEIPGNIIPDELFIGPDPLEADAAFVEAADDKTLTFGEDYAWTADFEQAVIKGLGFKIPLTADEAVVGFDKILALGVYSSSHETASKQAVEDLIDNHHYSPKGFSLVKQGTATNNTEAGGSGFSKSDPFDNISFFVETGKALFEKDTDCDGKNLADALGIEYDPLHYVFNSDSKDLKESRAMNIALYPSTLGYYFSTMMKPVLSEANQDTLRNFFTQYVTGRGPLPAIRVGDQPYGILLTSDFSKWKWTQHESGFPAPFLATLYKVLDHFHTIWKSLQDQLMFTNKPGVDPSDILMNILGLQSGSVSFFQRNAFTTEQLANLADFQFGGKYFKDIKNSFSSELALVNLLRTFKFEPPLVNGIPQIPQLLRLVFQHYHTGLDPFNVVEKFPLSEDLPLHNYADNKNYIHWLIETTSVQQLEKQFFGVDIQPPTSLLYMQLWRSLLLATADASVKWFGKHNISLAHVMEPASFHNIRPKRDLTKWEVMKGKISNALPAHPLGDKAIAEHLFTTGSNEDEAIYLKKMKEALGVLAGASTASLERCFSEHVDTCTYRLDAWQNALFDQRLKKQRSLTDAIEQPGRKKGIHLGAYGWVEDLRPGSKRQLSQSEVPSALQPPGSKPVYAYADNGGFIHAPSINQATTAAVLRSGYLRHASSANPDAMAVNLSSERVRRALAVIEGLRNGNSLEALLGFQFERGLHDRGSANDDLKVLNEYIYNFRDEFIITQHLVPQTGVQNAAADTIVRNNVVNGLTLAESKLNYPYNVTMDFRNFSDDKKAAIRIAIEEEKDKLEDTLDSIKDLFLSESVFQMVQGNVDRASAITTALRDANMPPAIEVIDTPLPSRLSFTNKVTIQFNAGQTYSGPSYRAKMEAGMNNWLEKVFGTPEQLFAIVSHKVGSATEQLDISLFDLHLELIDLLYMVGSDYDAGQKNAATTELESRFAFEYRRKKLLDDTVPVNIQFTGSVADSSKKFLGSVLPVVKTVKQLITDSRPLTAMDFDPPSKESLAERANPHGYDLLNLEQRINIAKAGFDGCISSISNIPISITTGSTTTGQTLGTVFTDLQEDSRDFSDLTFSFSPANADALQLALIDTAGFGVPDSFPQAVNITSDESKLILLEQARSITRKLSAIDKRIGELNNDLSAATAIETKIDILIQIGKALFGELFNILPQFNYNNPLDIQQSNVNRDQLLSHATNIIKMNFVADEWMQQSSAVRARLERWDSVRTIYELSNEDQLELSPVQLPYRANDSWLAVPLPKTNPDGSPFDITHDTFSIVIHGETAFDTTNKQCGLLIDDWTEVIPAKEVSTGLTFNYNQPDAMPPQALLLAVTPEEKGKWSWDDLVGILNDTLLRAKLRAVEPKLLDQVKKPDTGVLLPAIISTFSQHGLDISLDYRHSVAFYENNLPLSAIG